MYQSKKTRNRWFHIPINQTVPKHIRAVKHLVNLILFVVSIPVTLITLFLGVAVLMFWFCLSTPEDIVKYLTCQLRVDKCAYTRYNSICRKPHRWLHNRIYGKKAAIPLTCKVVTETHHRYDNPIQPLLLKGGKRHVVDTFISYN